MPNQNIITRMMRAARLEKGFYLQVAADPRLNFEALIVVLIAAVASGLGGFANEIFNRKGGNELTSLTITILLMVAGYFVWSYITYFMGTRLFGGKATASEVLRTTGYAYTPLVLRILVFLPCVGTSITILAALWSLFAVIYALRVAHDFETSSAIITALVGWLIIWVLSFVVENMLGVTLVGLQAIFQ